jgi:hypothetical protein
MVSPLSLAARLSTLRSTSRTRTVIGDRRTSSFLIVKSPSEYVCEYEYR